MSYVKTVKSFLELQIKSIALLFFFFYYAFYKKQTTLIHREGVIIMRKTIIKRIGLFAGYVTLAAALTACTSTSGNSSTSTSSSDSSSSTTTDTSSDSTSDTSGVTEVNSTDVFTDRDLEQTISDRESTTLTLTSGEDTTITEEGVYVISGDYTDTTIIVDTDDEAKVQIVLDGVTIENTDSPAIYVKNADKVLVTTTDSENSLSVTGTFTADGETNLDAVIFAKSNLVLNGTGTLTINSTEGNAVSSKDALKVTGGTYNITAGNKGLEANDYIAITDSTITIDSVGDGINANDNQDDSKGAIYIADGAINITTESDAIQATTTLIIDGGTINVSTCTEALESTYIEINGGSIDIYATDDGINSTSKSTEYDASTVINGGELTIEMGAGDTDAIDSNGSIIINGGTVTITANSPFDYDTTGEINGGTITVNGETVTEMTNQFGGGMGGQGGRGGKGAW